MKKNSKKSEMKNKGESNEPKTAGSICTSG